MASFTDRFGKDPGSWPLPVKVGLSLILAIALVAAWWGYYIREQDQEFETAQNKETQTLWPDLQKKAKEASLLPELLSRRAEAMIVLQSLERQLPTDSGIDKILTDVSDAGLNRGLQFELFKKMPEVQKEDFVEQPINITVSGTFHELARFASDVANLPRIVTLNDIKIESQKNNGNVNAKADILTLTTVAKIFRYPTAEERAKADSQQKAQKQANVKQ